MVTDGFIVLSKGDYITIQAGGVCVSGQVYFADYYGPLDGWYVELVNSNISGGCSYWKQGIDGGYITLINGEEINY